MNERTLPEAFARGPMQGNNVIGEVTESMHRFLLDGWTMGGAPPRIEEDLSFVPKDREEVIYVYMYKAAQNTSLMNHKRLRLTKFSIHETEKGTAERTYWERPPLYLELSYLVAIHSKFRSDAERLMGWVLLRLHEATHLVYRPRRYILPDSREVNSLGQPWDADNMEDDIIMEKVGLSLVDDLTVGDAINFFTIHEAPYRPYLTYRARCALEGALISGPPQPVEVDYPPLEDMGAGPSDRTVGKSGRLSARPVRRTTEEK